MQTKYLILVVQQKNDNDIEIREIENKIPDIEKKSNNLVLLLQLKGNSRHFLGIVVKPYIPYELDNWPRNRSLILQYKFVFFVQLI